MKEIRTRFAPSPTGYMHIGNLRTALYAYLVARNKGGDFILRIEDTDRARLVDDAVDVIYRSLKVTGLDWDEGPDVGGPLGPYVQSERLPIYREYAQKLVAEGHAYRCFCGKEEGEKSAQDSDEGEAESHSYDGRCSRLSEEEIRANLESGKPFVIRQRIGKEGSTAFRDEVYGEISIENKQLDDQVLLKSDGYPTYNFANVVDDHLMKISHVIRGCEYLSSTPKYIQLYRAFGWEPPEHIHLPHILGPSGKKLSKREGSVALSDFIDKGYLPEAIINYIALLGWNPGDDSEFFTLAGLAERFDIARINKAPAVFDEVKLAWVNALHIKAMAPEAFHEAALARYPEAIKAGFDLHALSALIQPRLERLADIPALLEFLTELKPYEAALYEHKKMKTSPQQSLPVLKDMAPRLAALPSWDAESLLACMQGYVAEKGFKNGLVMWPLRVALSGLPSTPGGAVEIACLLGREESLKRIGRGIALLGG
jgi:glutamyl-tRNA synthetase